MSDNQVNNLLGVTMDKIKQMVDVNTVIGDPVTTPDGTTVIPVSRVSYGFASGGSDLPSKAQPSAGLFAGGSGAGITISPHRVFDHPPGQRPRAANRALPQLGRPRPGEGARCGGQGYLPVPERGQEGGAPAPGPCPAGGACPPGCLTHSVSPARIGFCEAGDLC